MKGRIEKILETENLTASRFADIIQVQRSNVSHILAERNKPGLDFLQKVLQAFPSINGDWLLTGRGEMYVDSIVREKSNVTTSSPGVLQFKDEDPPVYQRMSSEKYENSPQNKESKVNMQGASKKVKKIILIFDDYSIETFDSHI